MELSDFLNTRRVPLPLPPDNKEYLQEIDTLAFDDFLNDYPEAEHGNITEELSYIREYLLNYPDFDGEQWAPSYDYQRFYKFREKILNDINLSETEFYNFKILQDSVAELGLSPKATFNFIAYLWWILSRWLYKGTSKAIEDRLQRAAAQIKNHPNESVSIDIKVGGKHYKFSDRSFIQSLITSYLNLQLVSGCITEQIFPTKREIDYILVATLLKHLPIKYKKEKRGKFTQAERNFGLCVLWLTGEINHMKTDNPEDSCSKENNVTFDKLIRDFKHISIPAVVDSM